MRSPLAAVMHNLRLCCTCVECLGDTGHLRGLVFDALVVNVVFCKKGLQTFFCRRGADGLVEDRNGVTRLTPELKFSKDSSLAAAPKFRQNRRKYTFMIRTGHKAKWGVVARQECWPLCS